MDFRDPKNQILLIVIAGFLILIYIWHASFYTPYAADLSEKKALHEKLQSDLFSVKQKAKSLNALKEEYDALLIKYEKIKLWLPEVKEDEAFLAQLHIAAQLTNSTIISVAPQAPIVKDFYNANSYIVELEAKYHNLGSFFAKVVNFPFIVNISDIQLKAKEEEKSMIPGIVERRPDLTVLATFKLSTYNSHQNNQQGGQAK